MQANADVVFVEIGGTVGDLENAYFIEAMRELAYEEGPRSSCFVALTYILEPPTLGEQKSKAAQLGIKQLMQMGIQPDIIACRADNPVSEKARQKISVYSNVPFERVFSMHDSASIYTIPAMLRDRGLDFEVLRLLQDRGPDQPAPRAQGLGAAGAISRTRSARKATNVTIGDHRQIHLRARQLRLDHQRPGARRAFTWAATSRSSGSTRPTSPTRTRRKHLADVDGIIVPGGFGTRGTEGKIACVQYARENTICRTWACASASRWR